MSSLFDIGKTGLNAYRQALSVTGQNIANINTDGYKRREASLEEISVGKGGVTAKASGTGAGVRVDGIRRSFDEFLLNKARSANSSAEASIAFFDQVSRLENILLSDESNLGTAMTAFFDSLQQIVAEPADLAPRTIALEQGRVLAGEFQRVAQVTDDLKSGIHDHLQGQIKAVNGLSIALAELNQQVATSSLGNQNNTLLDKRDALIDEISGYVNVSVELSENGVTTLRLGNSGDGPILVQANDTNPLRASKYDDKILFSTMVGATRVLTSQVSEGSLNGLAESYGSISNTMHEVDELAFKLVRDTNAIHANGINLDGDTGSIIFQNIDVNISENETNVGTSLVEYQILDHASVQTDDVTFSYDEKNDHWVGRYNNGAIAAIGRTDIQLPGLSISFAGEPEDFDQFVLEPVRGQASGVSFALTRPQDFAAASPIVSFSDPSNESGTVLDASRTTESKSSDLPPLEQVFTNGLGAVSATEFLSGGTVAVVPKNVNSLDLLSLTRQSTAQITMAKIDLPEISSLQLSISSTDASGVITSETYAFSLDQSNFNNDTNGWQDMAEIARLLNRGSILGTDSAGNEISLKSIGGFVSGAGGNLTLSLSADEFSSVSIGLSGGGTVDATLKARNDVASDVLILTREGRQIAGAPLSESAIEKWTPVIEGGIPFNDGAIFNDEYLNGANGEGYLDTVVTYSDNASDILLDIKNKIHHMAIYEPDNLVAGDIHRLILDDGDGNELTITPSALTTINSGDALQAIFDATQVPDFESLGYSFSYDTDNERLLVSRDDLVDFSIVYSPETVAFNDFSLPNLNRTSTDTYTLSIDGAPIVTTEAANYASKHSVAAALQTALDASGITAYDVISIDGSLELKYSDIANQTPTSYSVTYNGTGTGGSDGTGTIVDGNDALLEVSVDGGVTKTSLSEASISSAIDVAASSRTNSTVVLKALDGVDTNELSPDGLMVSAATIEYSLEIGDLSASIASFAALDFDGQAAAKSILTELRASAPIAQVVGLASLDTEFSYTLSDMGLDEAQLHASGKATIEYLGSTYKFLSDGATISVSGGSNFVRSLSYDNATQTVSGFARSLPEDGDEFFLKFEEQEYRVFVEDNEIKVSGGEEGRLIAYLDEDNILNIVSSQGSISKSEISIIDEADLSGNEDAAQRFGLISAGLSASTSFSDTSYVAPHFDITLNGDTLSVIPVDGSEPPTITGSARSLAGQRITVSNLPDEELIIIVRDDGAKRVAAQYDVAPADQITVPRDIEITVIDEENRIVEFIDKETGTSLATRQVDDGGNASAVSLNAVFRGAIVEGDNFTVANNSDGYGDGSALRDLIDLKSSTGSTTGRGGFQEMFNTSVANLGAVLQSSKVSADAKAALREASVAAEAAYSGVTLDSEAARLIEQQQAYQASARILATAREIFNTLVQSL